MHLKMSSENVQPSCFGLDMLYNRNNELFPDIFHQAIIYADADL